MSMRPGSVDRISMRGFRIWMLVLNVLPLLHAIAIASAMFLPVSWATRIALLFGVLYLIPPVMARAVLVVFPIRETRIKTGSKEFLIWWGLANLQGLFVRFAFLEELLRLVPGVYSVWLRLWGSKIGRLTYWAPGTLILDRSFLHIGNEVILGAGVRLNAHVIVANSRKENELLLETIRIGDNCIVGGYSLMTAGTVLDDGEVTRAFFVSPPFSHWKNGKRVRKAISKDAELGTHR